MPAIRARRFAIALAAMLVLALGLAAVWRSFDTAVAAPAREMQLLTFSGHGTAQLAPDSAAINVGVNATASSADDAQDKASRRMRELISHMREQGLQDRQLQTSGVTVHEDWEKEGRFRASQSLTISVDDASRAGELLGQATEGGADTVSGPAFGLEDQRAGYDEALRHAIADARAKADAAATQMGAEVVAVHSYWQAHGEVPHSMNLLPDAAAGPLAACRHFPPRIHVRFT